MKKEISETNVRSKVAYLDIILSILVICSSFLLIKTPLGSAILAFGFAMLTITLILRILQKW